MIIWRLIGVILQVLGNIIKRSDILFLGYYLGGTGKKRSLPVYSYEAVINEFGKGCEWNDTYTVHTFHENHLYTTIGKAWVKKDNSGIYIMDTYMFYPLCNNCSTHFSDCTCKEKTYASLDRGTYISRKIQDILVRIPVLRSVELHKKLGAYIKIMVTIDMLEFSISDEFWVKKGKPFEIYTEIPVYI